MNYKEKGNRYERSVAKKLSLWLSFGKDKDLLWRSDASGGRSTSSKSKLSSQAGDIAADSRLGYDFIDQFMVECKHYRNIGIENLIWKSNKQDNILTWWKRYTKEAKGHHKNLMLICKQNNRKELLFVNSIFLNMFEVKAKDVVVTFKDLDMHVLFLDMFLKIYDFNRIYIGKSVTCY